MGYTKPICLNDLGKKKGFRSWPVGPSLPGCEGPACQTRCLVRATVYEARAAAGDGGAAPVVSPGRSGPGMARAPSAARSSACYPGRTSTRSHATPPSPPCAARCPANSARHGDRWLVRALIGSLHPFLFPSLSLLSRAFALPRLRSPIPIRYCFLSFFVTLINYSFYMFRHVNIN